VTLPNLSALRLVMIGRYLLSAPLSQALPFLDVGF
jgi:hypothetical protein